MNKTIIAKAWKYAKLAHNDPTMIGDVFRDKETDTEGFCIEDGGILYVAIRGSTTAKDWKYNLFVKWWKGSHYGFYTKAIAILARGCLPVALHEAYYRKIPVVFCGHSAGGAVAEKLADRFMYNSEAITFAAPKVFAFWKRTAAKVTRFRLGSDLVPFFPFFLYKHIGKYIKLGGRLKLKNIGSDHMIGAYDKAMEEYLK